MAWTEKKGNVWQGKYRDANGEKRTAGSDTNKKKAEQLAQDEEAKIRNGTWQDQQTGKMTLATYFTEEWLPHRRQEVNTRKYYQTMYRSAMLAQIEPMPKPLAEMELRKITKPVVERWVTAMINAGVSAATIHHRFKALQTVLAAQKGVSALSDGKLAKNPCTGVDLPVLDELDVVVYSIEESEMLCEALGPWWASLPLLAAETGLRWGALQGLTVGDFDFEREQPEVLTHRTMLEVSKADTGRNTPFMWKPRPKGRRAQRIALGPDAVRLVKGIIRERRLFAETDRLFSPPSDKMNGLPMRTEEWPEGRPVFRGSFRDLWVKAHLETGIDQGERTFKSLRSSHLTWLLAGGADLATVQARGGHRDISTTQRYLTALSDSDTRALDALEATKRRYRPSA